MVGNGSILPHSVGISSMSEVMVSGSKNTAPIEHFMDNLRFTYSGILALASKFTILPPSVSPANIVNSFEIEQSTDTSMNTTVDKSTYRVNENNI